MASKQVGRRKYEIQPYWWSGVAEIGWRFRVVDARGEEQADFGWFFPRIRAALWVLRHGGVPTIPPYPPDPDE